MQKAATVNSHAIKSNTQSGSNTSLTRKIRDIFLFTPKDVLERIYAGLNSSYVSSKKQTIQTHGMFTPRGISDLRLTPAEITLLINSQTISDKERTDLQTYMKTTETISDPITHATVIEEQHAPPRKYYFYCYQYSMNGEWFSTMLYNTPEEVLADITDTGIVHKKLCCIVL